MNKASVFEDEPDQKEIDGYSHAIHRNGSPRTIYAQPKKKMKQENLVEIVDAMSCSKAHSLLCSCLATKCKFAWEIEISYKTQKITKGISNTLRHEMVADPIYEIVKQKRKNSNDGETQKLRFLVVCREVIFQVWQLFGYSFAWTRHTMITSSPVFTHYSLQVYKKKSTLRNLSIKKS